MAGEQMSDEEIVQTLPAEALSAKQRAALDRVLARLAAAEKVCSLVRGSLRARRKTAEKEKRVYWWDVAIALEEWEKAAKP